MPKLRMMTPQQKREQSFRVSVAAHAAALGLVHDKDVAEYIGISRQCYSGHKKTSFQNMTFIRAASMGRKMGMTGREWCAAAGIPYESSESLMV